MNKELNSIKMPEYRKLYNGKPNEQIEILIISNSNMKGRFPPCWVQVTRIFLRLQFVH